MFRPWRSVALPLAAVVLVAAACAGDDASAPPTNPPADDVGEAPTVPTVPAVNGPRQVVIIGDSISVGTEEEYPEAMPLDDVEVVATFGIRLGPQREAISLAVATRPDVLVIELGTNDVPVYESSFLDEIDEVLDETAGLPCVRWVNVFVPRQDEPVEAVNDHLEEAAEEHDNLEIVDWHTLVTDDPSLLSEDRLHPNEEGQRVLAQAVAASAADCGTG